MKAPPQRMTSAALAWRAGPAAADVLDADRPAALEEDPRHEGPGLHSQVGAAHGRVQVGTRRAQATAAVDVAVERPEALLAVAVDVIREPVAGLLGGLEEGAEQGAGGRSALEHEGAVVTPERVVGRRREAVLHAFEVGQAVGVVPGAHAGIRRPPFIVERVPALEDHAVDAAGAAQDLAAGVVDPAVVHERLGLRPVAPVVVAAADGEGQGGRHVDEDVEAVVGATRLQDQDAPRGVRAQAAGQHAPGRAAADDQDVVWRGHLPRPRCRSCVRLLVAGILRTCHRPPSRPRRRPCTSPVDGCRPRPVSRSRRSTRPTARTLARSPSAIAPTPGGPSRRAYGGRGGLGRHVGLRARRRPHPRGRPRGRASRRPRAGADGGPGQAAACRGLRRGR